MPANARLLVHAGASSKRRDDDRNRALLEAYLDIGPAHKSHSLSLMSSNPDRESELAQDRHADIPQGSRAGHPDSTTFIDDTQLAYTALESQLFTTFVAPDRSSGSRRMYSPAFAVPNPSAASVTPPSQDKSSGVHQSELNSSDLERASKRPRLQSDHVSARQDNSHPSPGSWVGFVNHVSPADQAHERQQTIGPRGISNEATSSSNDTTSQLPTTYSLSDLASGSLRERPRLIERSVSDPGPSSSSPDEVPVLPKSPETRQSGLGQSVIASGDAEEKATDMQASNKALPRKAFEARASPERLQAIEELRALSTSIDPPVAVTSLNRFTTHVTPALQHLASDSGLSSAFRPVLSSRHIDPMERGHWLVGCPEWPPEWQLKFWNTLQTVIGGGSAGWGVWCSRGKEAPLAFDSQTVESEQNVDASAFFPVRIYCWGEIVKHIYLLLYVASSSKVRKLGLQWIDAEGQVVVQMQGPPASTVPARR